MSIEQWDYLFPKEGASPMNEAEQELQLWRAWALTLLGLRVENIHTYWRAERDQTIRYSIQYLWTHMQNRAPSSDVKTEEPAATSKQDVDTSVYAALVLREILTQCGFHRAAIECEGFLRAKGADFNEY